MIGVARGAEYPRISSFQKSKSRATLAEEVHEYYST